jgi:hypothetical protein
MENSKSVAVERQAPIRLNVIRLAAVATSACTCVWNAKLWKLLVRDWIVDDVDAVFAVRIMIRVLLLALAIFIDVVSEVLIVAVEFFVRRARFLVVCIF